MVLALAPLALLSGAWMASIAGVGDTVAASVSSTSGDGKLAVGGTVPSQAIEAPASVPVAGVIAPSVPNGSADSVVSSASTSGIPAPALAAYQRGAQIIDAADTTCNIPWELIAAIGRVESDHGRYGGNTLTADGVSKPGIYGPERNGKDGTAAIKDTDGGDIDADPVYDRAVGPMQFIPSTWQVVKVDADGDGKRNPQDIDDASLATAVYLCSGTDNLANRKGQEAAVFRYNHSQSYVDLVLRIAEAYSQGDYSSVPSGTYDGTTFSPSYSTALSGSRQQTKAKQANAKLLVTNIGPAAPSTPHDVAAGLITSPIAASEATIVLTTQTTELVPDLNLPPSGQATPDSRPVSTDASTPSDQPIDFTPPAVPPAGGLSEVTAAIDPVGTANGGAGSPSSASPSLGNSAASTLAEQLDVTACLDEQGRADLIGQQASALKQLAHNVLARPGATAGASYALALATAPARSDQLCSAWLATELERLIPNAKGDARKYELTSLRHRLTEEDSVSTLTSTASVRTPSN